MTRAHVSLGVAGSLGPQMIARIAAEAEASGFHALWVNDTPDGDSLEALAAAANATERLLLCTGVVPVDRRPAAEIVRAVRDLHLPGERLRLGIGAGQTRQGALALVADAVRVLRDGTSAGVLVGALGPKMRLLAAEHADGGLLSWLSPRVAADQASQLRAAAESAGQRAGGYAALYARTALEPAAIARRDAEGAAYARFPAYAANYARLGIAPEDTMLPLPGDDGFAADVATFASGVDELVLRAIAPGDELEDYLRFIDTARGALALVQTPDDRLAE